MNTSIAPCQQGTSAEKPATLNSPYTFYITIPTLQEKTSHQIAMEIWYNYVSSLRKTNRVGAGAHHYHKNTLIIGVTDTDSYYDDCYRMIESLKMPRALEKDIKSAIWSILKETKSWIWHIRWNTFSVALKEHFINHFDLNWCVWLPNGKIDYAKTASKMTSDPSGLSLEQKFMIMSTFCMEEEIEKIPWRSLSESFITKVNFNQDFLIHYWICYLKNELYKIPLVNYKSIDALMAAKCESNQCTAFEYFFNRLGDDDLVSVVINKFSKDCYNTINIYYQQDLILSKMSWQQQNLVISEIPDIILTIFWRDLSSYEHAMQVWKHWKHSISPEKFGKVVKCVWYSRMSSEDAMRLLLEVWQSASDQQRNHLIQIGESDIIVPFFSQALHCKSSIDFVCKLLSEKSEEYRRQIMAQNAGKFGAYQEDPASVFKIIQLCFPNPDDQHKYKNSIMESKYMRNTLFYFGLGTDSNNLILKINFYSTSENMTLKFMNQLLQSQEAEKEECFWEYFTEVEKWNEFSHFVDEIFHQDATLALNFKKQFIVSYAQVCRHDWKDDSLDGTSKILKMVLTNDDELQLVKKNLLDSYQKLFFKFQYWEQFRENYFNNFVLWCLNGDRKARDEFIKNLPASSIFDGIFHELEDWYISNKGDWNEIDKHILECLNTFLRWYFKGVHGARMYKLRALNSIEKMVFKESALDDVLKWFFDGDEESMLKFKTGKMQVWEKSEKLDGV